MKLTQIRNATNRLEYAGKTFLIDPWLAPRHVLSFVDIPGMPYHVPEPVKENMAMPFYDLPLPVEKILQGVDYYLLTHIHPDHIDMAMDGTVGAPLDKAVPIICQNEADAEVLKCSGFREVMVLSQEGMGFGAAKLTQVPARHGTVVPCGEAMGVMFTADEEKTFYLAGDTVWYPEVQENIRRFQPDVIALNCAAAELVENGRLIMNDEDVWSVSLAAPEAKLYLTHMDNVAHATITRHQMRALLLARNVSEYDMPADGENIIY
ncbi:MAG: MBL fold metallo-hydrolase [Selenomonas sp.]|uniref:MBL fold metallo-hydrolase n=1 Tax=Selenomonas sp. TaxID=2053611 RepID=UPI0025EF4FB6|nr:MBL fold metallo-hydrolase [Selenomonas sp.]MCR5757960.1 MBL fold metallo-hydrolase [Selenomonas sp.]